LGNWKSTEGLFGKIFQRNVHGGETRRKRRPEKASERNLNGRGGLFGVGTRQYGGKKQREFE